MIYDYQVQEGYVSLQVGYCEDYDTLNEYLSTQYLEEHEIGEEPGEIWKELFLPTNQDRACEEELKDAFNYEDFNQFEYDFGLVFDEDFREAVSVTRRLTIWKSCLKNFPIAIPLFPRAMSQVSIADFVNKIDFVPVLARA